LSALSKEELVGLTSLRGLAALAVVLQHFSATVQKLCAVPIPSLVPHGYVAVDFFFVLSGYVMCYTYLHAFQQRESGIYASFLKKRAVRLLPLNAFVLCLMMIGAAISTALLGRNIFYGSSDAPLELPANFLMLQGLGLGNSLNGPAWSVSAEIGAYVLFPLLIVGAFSRRRAVVVAVGLLALLGLTLVALRHPRLGLGSEDPIYGGLRCVSQFTIGMLSYRLAQWPRAAAWFAQDRVAFGLVALAVLLLLGPRVDLLTAATFPLIIVAAALNRSRFDRLMAQRPLVVLGLASYSLYMIHDPLRSLLHAVVKQWHPEPLSAVAALLLALIASLAVVPLAVLTYHAVEKPSRNYLRRWVATPRARIRPV
jgi:peptidoglycan/LPS O-acetylase OafA/YrhL